MVETKKETRGRKQNVFGRIRDARRSIRRDGGVVVNLTVPMETMEWAKATCAMKEMKGRSIMPKNLLVYAMVVGSQGVDGAILEELAKRKKD